jgi:hypothetical protein
MRLPTFILASSCFLLAFVLLEAKAKPILGGNNESNGRKDIDEKKEQVTDELNEMARNNPIFQEPALKKEEEDLADVDSEPVEEL